MGIVSVESLNVNLPWGAYGDYDAWAPGGLFDAGVIGKSIDRCKARLFVPQLCQKAIE